MPMVIAPESELGKELAKWNTPRNRPIVDSNGDPILDPAGREIMGMGAIGFEPYPKMLYKAKPRNGKAMVLEPLPLSYEYDNEKQFEQAVLRAETMNRQCWRIVHDDTEEKRAHDEGWRTGQKEALDHYEGLQQDMAQAAAEAAHAAQRMSEKARKELAAADDVTHEHVVDVASAPKRGRKRKPRAVTGKGIVEAEA